jgi:diketogulonate reductase-like aldo/keto reductase
MANNPGTTPAEIAKNNSLTLRSGGRMPLLGFGTWQAKEDDAYRSVKHALATGYRHIDTAAIYGNETEVGRAIRDSGVPRDEIFLTTKLPPSEAGKERATITGSLDRLGTGFVDLWLVHWPPDGEAAPDTWREFIAAQKDGLARAIGVSNYSPGQIDELIAATGYAPEVNQIKWAPALFDPARLAHSRERDVVLEGYSPLRASDLGNSVLAQIALAHGVTVAQVIMRWHLEHETVVIPKSVTPERIEQNFDVFGFGLSELEVAAIDGLAEGE